MSLASLAFENGFISEELKAFNDDLELLLYMCNEDYSLMAFLLGLKKSYIKKQFEIVRTLAKQNIGKAIETLLDKPWSEVRAMIENYYNERKVA